jgi:hypothetical protein
MHPAITTTTARVLATTNERFSCESFTGIGTGLIGFLEPWAHSRKHSHEAAGLQQFAAKLPARAEVVVQALLVDFVHVQETVRSLAVECCVGYVFPHDTCPLLLTAPKKVSTVVVMVWAFVIVILVVQHRSPLRIRQFFKKNRTCKRTSYSLMKLECLPKQTQHIT